MKTEPSFRIDHESYGQAENFASLRAAERAMRACGFRGVKFSIIGEALRDALKRRKVDLLEATETGGAK